MTRAVFFAVAVLCSTPALAQEPAAPPKAGTKQLAQAKPKVPFGCKLVGTVKGTKIWVATAWLHLASLRSQISSRAQQAGISGLRRHAPLICEIIQPSRGAFAHPANAPNFSIELALTLRLRNNGACSISVFLTGKSDLCTSYYCSAYYSGALANSLVGTKGHRRWPFLLC